MSKSPAQKKMAAGLLNPTHINRKNGHYATVLHEGKDISTDQRGKVKIVYQSATGRIWIMNKEQFEETHRVWGR